MFSAIRQASRASLPDETPTACVHPEYAAMAFSHWSTFGPNMKCCDSSTSAIAISISALMAAYCALRSSNKTFILRFLLQFPIGFDTDPQFGRQGGLFVEVEAAEDTGCDFPITVAAFGAPHYPVIIG